MSESPIHMAINLRVCPVCGTVYYWAHGDPCPTCTRKQQDNVSKQTVTEKEK